MKRLSFLLLVLMAIIFDSNGQSKEPDFAYPKTVVSEAKADLKNAEKHSDAKLALNALLRMYVAEKQIDPSLPQQKTIETSVRLASKFAGNKLEALYPLLEASMYAIYLEDNWYRNRETPLLPLPADITEWSTEQLIYKINQLITPFVNDEPSVEKLADCPIDEYKDIVNLPEDITSVFFPTLRDFAYIKACSLAEEIAKHDSSKVDLKRSLAEKALQLSEVNSAPRMYWSVAVIQHDNNYRNNLKKLIDENSGNEYVGYALSRITTLIERGEYYDPYEVDIVEVADVDDDTSDYQAKTDIQRWFVDQASAFLAKWPKSYFAPEISLCRYNLLKKKITLTYNEYCTPGKPFDVFVNNNNVTSYNLQVFRLDKDPKKFDIAEAQKYAANHKPVAEYPVNCKLEAPFKSNDTVTITIPEPGVYFLFGDYDGIDDYIHNTDRRWMGSIDFIKCRSLYPFSVTDSEKGNIVVVNPTTGFPIEGAMVSLLENGRKSQSAVTDAQGIATVKPVDKRQQLLISHNGEMCTYDNCTPIKMRLYNNNDHSYNANVLTDRAIYHPGDSVNFLVVASEVIPGDEGLVSKTRLLENNPVTVELYNANYQIVDTSTGITDSFGRIHSSFVLPSVGLTGNFTIRVKYNGNSIGSRSFMVSDYKMPDFEVSLNPVQRSVPTEGDVTITGRIATYSGMPLAGVKVNISVRGGYWWHAYDLVGTVQGVTAADGSFSVVIGKDVFSDDDYRWYQATVDAVSPSGTTAQGTVSFSLGKPYTIKVDSKDNVDGNVPYRPSVTVLDAEGKITKIPLHWKLTEGSKSIAEGDFTGEIDLSRITPGRYQFAITPDNSSLADVAMCSICIYNTDTDISPLDQGLWLLSNRVTADTDGLAEILYAVNDDCCVFIVKSYGDGHDSIITSSDKKGYHRFKVQIGENDESGLMNMILVQNWSLYNETVRVDRAPKESMVISCETFRDRLVPGNSETWKFTVKGESTDGTSALALDMYNKALDALVRHNFNLYFPVYYNFISPEINRMYVHRWNLSLSSPDSNILLNHSSDFIPLFKYIDILSSGRWAASNVLYSKSSEGIIVKKSRLQVAEDAEDAYYDMNEAETASVVAGGEIDEESSFTETFDYREADVPLALWAPMLTTDSEGNVSCTFTVPNAVTTWRLLAASWNSAMEHALLSHEFIASKPLMVQPNLPRFLRTGDEAVISSLVLNNTDRELTASVTIQIFDPVDNKVIKTENIDIDIEASASATVDVNVKVFANLGAVGYRIIARTATNGSSDISQASSDGEQAVIPVLPNIASIVETTPFYLNPGETEYSQKLPEGDDVRLTLTFCENPAWTIVTALPGLRTQIDDYANSAAAALFSALVARGILQDNPTIAEALRTWQSNPDDAALVSMLEKNEDLKQAVLNATPWVQAAQSDSERMANLSLIFDKKETQGAINQAVAILTKLQRNDGGWSWAEWCNESSVWVTENVLEMVWDLKRFGWWPADKQLDEMVDRAVRYLDSKVENTDIEYTIIRKAFTSVPISSNGKDVIKKTVKDIRSHWKKYSDPAYKSIAAMAVYVNGEERLAREIMASVSEFGVMTPSQGLVFPSVNSLFSYAGILDAFATICPGSSEIDGLRQQLIVRKQATDWGSAVVTTQVVSSILSTGTVWTVQASGADVTAGNESILPSTPIETATGAMRADISRYAGETLTVHTTGVGPAYGAVFAQYLQNMADVEASSIDDLSIEKQMFVRDQENGKWQEATELKVGDRVKVQLTIHNKRNMEYVSIIDERPAAFEPVLQLPGWEYCDNAVFYRENRDSFTALNIVHLRPGTYLLTYEMNVNSAGTYSSGVATIQSQYAPELTAHSSGVIINIKR